VGKDNDIPERQDRKKLAAKGFRHGDLARTVGLDTPDIGT